MVAHGVHGFPEENAAWKTCTRYSVPSVVKYLFSVKFRIENDVFFFPLVLGAVYLPVAFSPS